MKAEWDDLIFLATDTLNNGVYYDKILTVMDLRGMKFRESSSMGDITIPVIKAMKKSEKSTNRQIDAIAMALHKILEKK